MVVCGDPTLVVNPVTSVRILQPTKGFYIGNNRIFSFLTSIVIGSIDVEVGAFDNDGIDRVEFFIDGELKESVTDPPFIWNWNEKMPFKFRHILKVKAFDLNGNFKSDEMIVWKIG